MSYKNAGYEPQNDRKTTARPQYIIVDRGQDRVPIVTHDLSKSKVQRVAEAWYERNKHLPIKVAGATTAVTKAAGIVGLCAGTVGGTAYAIYWTAEQAVLWLSAQSWTKPVLIIVLLSAGLSAAWQYSRDSIARTRTDSADKYHGQDNGQRGQRGHHGRTSADTRTETRTTHGQTIIINQYNSKP